MLHPLDVRCVCTVRTIATCFIALGLLLAAWSSGRGNEEPPNHFVEVQNGNSTTSFDLSTVQMIRPGRFAVIFTDIDNPDVTQFELKVLATLRTYCARSAGKYRAPADLLMLGPPTTTVENIEVSTPTPSEKNVGWTYPYKKGVGHLVGSLICKGENKTEAHWYFEARAEITNGTRMKELFDCRRGLSGLFVNEDDDPAMVMTHFVLPGTVGEDEYGRLCLSVMREPPYLPGRLREQNPAAPSAAAKQEPPPGQLGTAFFVSQSGFLLTNAHVVVGCSEVSVGPIKLTISPTPEQMAKAKAAGLSDDDIATYLNQPLTARVIARDQKNDLALLRADVRPQAVAVLRPSARQGEAVVAYGFPLPGLLATGGNLTTGNITALAGIGDDSRFLQMSAPVQPGNSGGPLLDNSGNVVGIVEGKLDAVKVASAIGDLPQNVNFAIKAEVVTTFLNSNGVHYSVATLGAARSPADIAEEARRFTVPVECDRSKR